jgi:saccharopine dehydrogenase-like NADP-dependent oxidoreductase
MESFAVEGPGPLRPRVAARAGVESEGAVMERLAFAGLFSGQPIGVTRAAPIDVLCARMQETMAYAPGERDMIVLRHDFATIGPDGRPSALIATLVAFGEPRGDSAMARTVALPAAVAARLVLDQRIGLNGVRIPVDPEIYEPVLDALGPMGIMFEETRSTP